MIGRQAQVTDQLSRVLSLAVDCLQYLCCANYYRMSEQSDKSDKSVSNLMKNLTLYGSLIIFMLILTLLVIIKLRLLAKFGYYLGGVGLCLIVVGSLLLFNTGLLLLGNLLILAGQQTEEQVSR